LEGTTLSFGTVCAPGQRYHPAIVAQGAATLSTMFEERFWLALGSGEALNESITGDPWPSKDVRNQRLRESVDVVRRLFDGETVDFEGTIRIKNATLFTRPRIPPKLFGAALTPETAGWMGPIFDGLITAGSNREGLAKVLAAFRANGGAGKPAYLQTAFSYASTKDEAVRMAYQSWRHAALDITDIANLSTPQEFDAATVRVEPESLFGQLKISDSLSEILDEISSDAEIGFDCVYLHYLGENTPEFLETAGNHFRSNQM
jgi:G6PDH family F420-dependent oxidoreductase